jgi:hypothetical protein
VLRQDYIGRLIEQLTQALARAAKLAREGQPSEAEAELASAEQALALPRGIELFDARSAALVIGSGDKVVLAALMLEHRAIVLEAKGDSRGAKQHKKRACALLDHARPHELVSEAAELRARLEQG